MTWVAADAAEWPGMAGAAVLPAVGVPGATPTATVLAEAVVRAERSLTRQAARGAAASRIDAVRYVDALAVLTLLLPWSRGEMAGASIVRSGLQSAGLMTSLALTGIVLRQVVLAAVAAQPDRRGPLTLTLVGTVTGAASILALLRLPVLAQRQGSPHVELAGPLLFGAAAVAAAVLTVCAGRSIARARPAPDLLGGLWLATAADVQVRIDAVEIALRQRTADPLPATGVLGLVVATAGAQASWAEPFAARWIIAISMGGVMALAVLPVRRSTVACAEVLAGGGAMLFTVRAVLSVRVGVGEETGAWLSLAGALVTTLCGVAVLLGRHARRVRVE